MKEQIGSSQSRMHLGWMKKSILTAIGEQILKYSKLPTVLFECSQLIYQRPIGRNPTSPDQGSYICPDDLLLGRSTSSVPPGPFKGGTTISIHPISCHWKEWTRDCFPNMVIRSKMAYKQKEICRRGMSS